jgi:hypothetical protein
MSTRSATACAAWEKRVIYTTISIKSIILTLSRKNPDPKDPALNCPLRGLPYSFPLAAVCWSDGVVE